MRILPVRADHDGCCVSEKASKSDAVGCGRSDVEQRLPLRDGTEDARCRVKSGAVNEPEPRARNGVGQEGRRWAVTQSNSTLSRRTLLKSTVQSGLAAGAALVIRFEASSVATDAPDKPVVNPVNA